MPTTTRFTTRVALSRANIPPPPTPSVLRSNCLELEGPSALLYTQLTPTSSPPNPRSRSRHSPHLPATVTYFNPAEHEEIGRAYQVHNRTPRAEKELLVWAARLRYSNQILRSREETKAFTSKLCELASQREPSGLVKKVLTLVRSTTRSGRAYGVSPPDNPDVSTAQGEAFSGRMKEVFPKLATKLGSVPEEEGEAEGKCLDQQQFSLASPHRVNYFQPLGLEKISSGELLSLQKLAASLRKEKRIRNAKRKRRLSRFLRLVDL